MGQITIFETQVNRVFKDKQELEYEIHIAKQHICQIKQEIMFYAGNTELMKQVNLYNKTDAPDSIYKAQNHLSEMLDNLIEESIELEIYERLLDEFENRTEDI